MSLQPLFFFLFDMSGGLLGTKTADVLEDIFWKVPFYIHMIFGGIALLIGWPQFKKSWRNKYLNFHRKLGKGYMVSVGVSGFMGLLIAANATGGIVSEMGFSVLAVLWLFTTFKGWVNIRNKDIARHENWMIRSYALCFAGVTLRLWIPIFLFLFGLEFLESYRIISWLCWVPNLLVAEVIIYSKSKAAIVKV